MFAWRFIVNVVNNRAIITTLALRELLSRYVGSVGGPFWSIIEPVATVLVFWFVFSVGFKAIGPKGEPFIIYFLPGYIIWYYFSQTISSNVQSIISNAYLVKQIKFPTEIIPLINLASSLFPHLVMISVVVIATILTLGVLPVTFIFLPVFLLGTILFSLGISWALSSLQVFFRDIGHSTGIILNLWFWLTPICWHSSLMPPSLKWFIVLNPIYYLIEGYRYSLTGLSTNLVGWTYLSLYFWGITLLLLLIGGMVFRRLKPQYADVL